MFDDYKKVSAALREVADVCDKLAVLEEREKAGEDVQEEQEMLLGILLVKVMKMQKEM